MDHPGLPGPRRSLRTPPPGLWEGQGGRGRTWPPSGWETKPGLG